MSTKKIIRAIVISGFALLLGFMARTALRLYSESLPLAKQTPLEYETPIHDWPEDDPIEVPEDEVLTVEETIGLAVSFGYVHLEKRANPAARPKLWEIIQIDDDGIRAFHSNAFIILGRIGDDSDAARMVEVLQSYSGVLNMASEDRVNAIIGALGLMAHRGIPAAMRHLEEMSDSSYWKGRFKYMPDKVRHDPVLPPELATLVMVIHAQARAKKKDYDALYVKTLAGIANEGHRQTVALEIPPERIKRQLASMIQAEQRKPSELDRRGLQEHYARREYLIKATSEAQHQMWDNYRDAWLRPKPLRK